MLKPYSRKYGFQGMNNVLQENNIEIGQIGKANACFVVLTRSSELNEIRSTMRQIEDRFNRKYNYPYVFLNDEPFTEEFKNFTKVMTKAKIEYGLVPKEHWSIPNHIDIELANERMRELEDNGVPYGGALSYHHMCRNTKFTLAYDHALIRFYSGFFHHHELINNYDYYWRLEPGVEYYCDIDFDPFIYMKENDIKYGFTLVPPESLSTVPTLWSTMKEFMIKHPHLIENDTLLEYLTDDSGDYNLCQFQSNFEIADLSLWRGEAYTKFFNFLEEKGGFYYERWGDAPVHTIATALFLKKHQVRFFEEIAYRHGSIANCPKGNKFRYKCLCNPDDSLEKYHKISKTEIYKDGL
ncbi:8822_t:CDS:2 [Dentiscutata erythropus]|uniref:8822_t:CDS:1 n=1 Tax=Dentiscutata erythropus TaxID=1348616 RepID=A0A9N8VV30_9GLOM|nr:8822_t:CDS:2 [Dentiscutata erythropus]